MAVSLCCDEISTAAAATATATVAATAALATATAAAAAATATATAKATTTVTTTATAVGRVCKERVGISRHVTMRHVKTTETLKTNGYKNR